MKRVLTLGLALALTTGLAGMPALAKPVTPPSTATVNWTGNGMTADGEGGYNLNTSLCDGSSTPYLLFILSGTKATTASINLPFVGGPTSMTRANVDKQGWSTFKYNYTPGSYINLAALLANPVTATYNDALHRGMLTVSKGCVGVPIVATCTSAPENTVAPVITWAGSPNAATTNTGTWTDIPNCTNTYSYQWYVYDPLSSSFWDPVGTDSNSYTPGTCDEVKVAVTATNEFGNTSIESSSVVDNC